MKYYEYNSEDFAKYDGWYLYGRIRMYDMEKGYGFIYTEDGKDIYMSSYALSSHKQEQYCILGTIVKFRVEQRGERYCAIEVEIMKPTPLNERLLLPNGEQLLVRRISHYGIIGGEKVCDTIGMTREFVLENDCALWELGYVYITLTHSHGEYRFFRTGSRVKGDGHVDDLEAFIHELDKKFLYM